MQKDICYNRVIAIADLYPQLSEEQRIEAAENFERYIALALRVFERNHQGAELAPQTEITDDYSPTQQG